MVAKVVRVLLMGITIILIAIWTKITTVKRGKSIDYFQALIQTDLTIYDA